MARVALQVPAWRRFVPGATASMLAILIALDLVHFAREIERSRHLVSHDRHVSAPVGLAAHGSEDNARTIASAHLFGAADIVALAQREESAANRVRSNLVLTGVIALKKPQDGYAILGEKGEATQLYHAGAALTESASVRLYQVFADRVVLDTGGRYEILRLPRPGIGAPLPVVKEQTQAQWGASAPQEIPLQLVTAAESMFANLDAVEDRDDGKLTGMRVHPPKYLRRLYGIEDGDVVTAVNGIAITSRDALARSLKDSGAAVTLTVVRGGVEQTLSMPVSN